jgi:multiple sugar transport system substrate-binding protein
VKKVVSLFAVFAFACTMFSGCSKGKSHNKKEEVNLIVKCPTLVMNYVTKPDIVDTAKFLEMAGDSFAQQYEDANVNIDVVVFDLVDENEAVTGSFDTDHAMDILYEDYFNMSAYVHTGRVVPLDDIITENIKNDVDESSWEMSSVNNKIYMMPFLSRQNILMYNKDLMKKCGLEKYVSDDKTINNWSTDEWTEILDTLAENLPENVYPMFMYAKNNQGDTHIMSLIRAFGSNIFDENGNFNFEDEKAVRALTWLQSGVDKGWYPPHSENLEIADAQELFNNNQLVFYVFNNANIVLYDDLDNYGFVNFPGNVATSFVTGFEVFDNGDETKVKVAKDFIKYIYETDEYLEMSVGNIPESIKTREKYADQITMLGEFSKNAVNEVDFMNNSPNWQGNETSVRSVFWPNIHNLILGATTPEECAKALDEDCNRALEIGRENSVLHE